MFIQVTPVWRGNDGSWKEESPTLLNVLYIVALEAYDCVYQLRGGGGSGAYSIYVKGPFEELRFKIEEAARHSTIVEPKPQAGGNTAYGDSPLAHWRKRELPGG